MPKTNIRKPEMNENEKERKCISDFLKIILEWNVGIFYHCFSLFIDLDSPVDQYDNPTDVLNNKYSLRYFSISGIWLLFPIYTLQSSCPVVPCSVFAGHDCSGALQPDPVQYSSATVLY